MHGVWTEFVADHTSERTYQKYPKHPIPSIDSLKDEKSLHNCTRGWRNLRPNLGMRPMARLMGRRHETISLTILNKSCWGIRLVIGRNQYFGHMTFRHKSAYTSTMGTLGTWLNSFIFYGLSDRARLLRWAR